MKQASKQCHSNSCLLQFFSFERVFFYQPPFEFYGSCDLKSHTGFCISSPINPYLSPINKPQSNSEDLKKVQTWLLKKMINLLFLVVFLEMALIIVLLFKTPLRKLMIMGLDRLKRGRGPLMVKSVVGTIIVVLLSSVYSMIEIQRRWIENDASNPTDQVLMAKHLIEATLMGAVIFLVFMIDRLHHYIRELRTRRKSMEAIKKQNRGPEDGKTGSSEEMKALEDESAKLREEVKRLESELVSKTKDVDVAEGNAVALRKQSEGFLLEYDRLLEENQNLRNQLQSLDWKLSHAGGKKNM